MQQVPRSAFGDQKIEVGMQFQTNQGQVVTVTNVGLDSITVDANHPLAGIELNFDVEMLEIRTATEEELCTRSCSRTRWSSSLMRQRIHTSFPVSFKSRSSTLTRKR